MTVWLRFAVSLIAVSLPSSTAGGDAPPTGGSHSTGPDAALALDQEVYKNDPTTAAETPKWSDDVLNHMPRTMDETKAFLEHVAALGRNAIDLELDHDIPQMFHKDTSKDYIDHDAQDEIGKVMAMLLSHQPSDSKTGHRRLAEIVDAPVNHMSMAWEMDWETGKVVARPHTADEAAEHRRHNAPSGGLDDFRTNSAPRHRAEAHDSETGSTTMHFPGPINANDRAHAIKVEHAAPRDETMRLGKTESRRRLARRRLGEPCTAGSSTTCPTTVSVSDAVNDMPAAMGTYSIVADAPDCAGSKVYRQVTNVGSSPWWLYRYQSPWTGLYRRWILTSSEWDARACVYIGTDTTLSSGDAVVFYTSETSPGDVGAKDWCYGTSVTAGTCGGHITVAGTGSARAYAMTNGKMTLAPTTDDPITDNFAFTESTKKTCTKDEVRAPPLSLRHLPRSVETLQPT